MALQIIKWSGGIFMIIRVWEEFIVVMFPKFIYIWNNLISITSRLNMVIFFVYFLLYLLILCCFTLSASRRLFMVLLFSWCILIYFSLWCLRGTSSLRTNLRRLWGFNIFKIFNLTLMNYIHVRDMILYGFFNWLLDFIIWILYLSVKEDYFCIVLIWRITGRFPSDLF